MDKLKAAVQYPLPHHAISRLVFRLTRIESPAVQRVMRWFVRHYDVDLNEAAEPRLEQYPSFNAFFTRALKADARVVAERPDEIPSPADGRISQRGDIENGTLLQAKGHRYTLLELLGGDQTAATVLANGSFVTVYLSPRDYHRLHMPLKGRLLRQTHVPGRLFSVAPHTVNNVPRLFARNERVIAQFDTDHGRMALVLVGAVNVAAIETVWHGLVTPPRGQSISVIDYAADEAPTLERGAEMGRFNMGSTIIAVFEKKVHWRVDMVPGDPVRMGQLLGLWR